MGWLATEWGNKIIILFFTVCQFWLVLSAHLCIYLHLQDGEVVWERTKLLTLRGTLEQSSQLPTAAAQQLHGLFLLQYSCKAEMCARCLHERQMYKEGQRWMFLFTWTCYIQLYYNLWINVWKTACSPGLRKRLCSVQLPSDAHIIMIWIFFSAKVKMRMPKWPFPLIVTHIAIITNGPQG